MRNPKAHSPHDATKLAAAAFCDPRTARKWLDGEEVKKLSVSQRIAEAAKQLGLSQNGAAQ